MIHFSNYLICYKKCKRVLETHMYVYMMQSFIQFCRRQSTVRSYEANVLGLLANPTKHNAKVWSIHLIEHDAKVWSNLEVIQSNRWDAVLMLGATLRPFLETVAIINSVTGPDAYRMVCSSLVHFEAKSEQQAVKFTIKFTMKFTMKVYNKSSQHKFTMKVYNEGLQCKFTIEVYSRGLE